MKGKKHFCVQSGTSPKLTLDSEADYTLRVGDYRSPTGKSHRERDVKYDHSALEGAFDKDVPRKVRELVELGVATFAIDKMVKRGPIPDDKESLSSRRVRIIFPVTSPEWLEIEDELSHTVSFLTRDSFEFDLRLREADKQTLVEPIGTSETDCISMFSGGLDSLGGAFKLQQEARNPQFVTVNHGHGISPLVENFIPEVFDDESHSLYSVYYSGSTNESTQFSRSFMYLGFGIATAIAEGASEIITAENGIQARFLALTQGWQTTRTVNPTFIDSYKRILDGLFPELDLEIQNPFDNETKVTVVDCVPQKELILRSRSCPYYHHIPKKDKRDRPLHCGRCIPCLVRIVSLCQSKFDFSEGDYRMDKNALTEIDYTNPTEYTHPDSDDKADYSNFLVGFVDLLRFAGRIRTESQEQIASQYPTLLDDEVYEMHLRFANELVATIQEFVEENRSLKEFSERFISY